MITKKLSKCNFLSSIARTRACHSVIQLENDAYTREPVYPPIHDLSREKRWERNNQAEYDEIQQVKTVEEKQIKLNMPRYYGFKCHMTKEDYIPYNNLTIAQHATRTYIFKTGSLPNFYNSISVDIGEIKENVEESILMELEGYLKTHDICEKKLTKTEKKNFFANAITKQLHRILVNNLSRHYEHLNDAQVDYRPRIEAVWAVGGLQPPKIVEKIRTGNERSKAFAKESVDRHFAYAGEPLMAVRYQLPLEPLITDSECQEYYKTVGVPEWTYDPVSVGLCVSRKYVANVPGFWPGDKNQFGSVSWHSTGHMAERHYSVDLDSQDPEDAVLRQGIMASFAWLFGQANFLGFTCYNDLTYPLTTQTILTNGQTFSLFAYQMNTIKTHSKHVSTFPRRNLCWTMLNAKLYEELQDGKLIGFNDDLITTIARMYANKPSNRAGVDLRPYLNKETQVIAQYSDLEKRNWLETEYKKLASNRPRHFLDYEIYHWEKIYKIDSNTRPLDARRRPFELNQNPWKRRLDDRLPRYIPKALRPELKKNQGRFAKSYFP